MLPFAQPAYVIVQAATTLKQYNYTKPKFVLLPLQNDQFTSAKVRVVLTTDTLQVSVELL